MRKSAKMFTLVIRKKFLGKWFCLNLLLLSLHYTDMLKVRTHNAKMLPCKCKCKCKCKKKKTNFSWINQNSCNLPNLHGINCTNWFYCIIESKYLPRDQITLQVVVIFLVCYAYFQLTSVFGQLQTEYYSAIAQVSSKWQRLIYLWYNKTWNNGNLLSPEA